MRSTISLAKLWWVLWVSCGAGFAQAQPMPPYVDADVITQEITLTFAPTFGMDSYRILLNPDGISGFSPVYSGTNKGFLIVYRHHVNAHEFDWLNARFYVEACSDLGGCTRTGDINVMGRSSEAIGYLKAFNADSADGYGTSIAISQSGPDGVYGNATRVLAIGSPGEDSTSVAANTKGATESGAVYLRKHSGSTWSEVGYLKASPARAGARFGAAVAISDDGGVVAVGAPGVEVVYVYELVSDVWTLTATLSATPLRGKKFGTSVDVSGDGLSILVGAPGDDSAANGVNGSEWAGTSVDSGAAYVFSRTSRTEPWSRQAYLKASNTGSADEFGSSVAIDESGATLIVGAKGEDGSKETVTDSGAAYVFSRTGTQWRQGALLKGSNAAADDEFGSAVAMSDDGLTTSVGAPGRDDGAGAAYVFTQTSSVWSEQAIVRAPAAEADDRFGAALALDEHGDKLVVGSFQAGEGEDGNSSGAQGNIYDNSAANAGAAHSFDRSNGDWTHRSYIKASNTEAGDGFGCAVAYDPVRYVLAVAACHEDANNNAVADSGAVYVY